jgi:hypothetical protein
MEKKGREAGRERKVNLPNADKPTGGAVLLGDKVAVSPLFQGLGALHREGGEEGAVEGEGEG